MISLHVRYSTFYIVLLTYYTYSLYTDLTQTWAKIKGEGGTLMPKPELTKEKMVNRELYNSSSNFDQLFGREKNTYFGYVCMYVYRYGFWLGRTRAWFESV